MRPNKIGLSILALVLSSACSNIHATIPGADIPFAKAAYDLKGLSSEKSCGVYIIGINFARLFSTQDASIGGGEGGLLSLFFGGGTPEEGEALYNALEKVPDATHLLTPRVKNTFAGFGTLSFPLFGQRCAEVKTASVKIGGPNSAQ